jgi:uncharacterized LabA/DUF88 family protein
LIERIPNVTTSERGKTIVFIDDSNVFHGQRDAGWRIDWGKFDKWMETQGQIWQTYFFASRHEPPKPEEENFFEFITERLRWELTTYELGRRTIRCANCGREEVVPTEKGVDVGLAIKMLSLGIARAYETAILVAGDRDYVETVREVKALGLRVEVMAWRNSLSDDLDAAASEKVIYLDNLRREIGKD